MTRFRHRDEDEIPFGHTLRVEPEPSEFEVRALQRDWLRDHGSDYDLSGTRGRDWDLTLCGWRVMYVPLREGEPLSLDETLLGEGWSFVNPEDLEEPEYTGQPSGVAVPKRGHRTTPTGRTLRLV